MKIAIVHLSDLHVKINSKIDRDKLESISKIIKYYKKINEHVLVIITGDIAFSGKKEEYEIAGNFINEIKAKSSCDFEVICCPGNHDCELEKQNEVRDDLIDRIIEKQLYTKDHEKIITEVQKNYFEFNRMISSNASNQIELHQIYESKTNKVIINSVNSVWMSKINHKVGCSFIDYKFFRVDNRNNKLSLLVMHQPINWFVPDLQRKIRNEISRNYTFAFTGHEHDSSEYKITRSRTDDNVIMFEGGELSPFECNERSTFSVIQVDLKSREYLAYEYNYCIQNRMYKYSDSSEDSWVAYTEKKFTAFFLELKESFRKYILDPGAPFLHPSGLKLEFNDIFTQLSGLRLAEQLFTIFDIIPGSSRRIR